MKCLLCLCLLLTLLCAVTHCLHQDVCHEVNSTYLHDGTENLLKYNCDKQASNYADFAFRFYQQAVSDEADKNVFFSPFSISTAFAMLAVGARSTTLSQILVGLGFVNLTETDIHHVHESFYKVLAVTNCTGVNNTLNIGNALFTADGYELQEKFLQNTGKFYDADIFPSNFHQLEEAKNQINTYVKEKTKGKITELIDYLDPSTALVLLNYIYFKGKIFKVIFQQIIFI